MHRGLPQPRRLDAADHGHRDARGLSHHELRCSCELVGDTDLGNEQLPTHRVDLTTKIDDRGNSGDTDRNVGEPTSPDSTKGVGDNYTDGYGRMHAQPVADAPSGTIGIDRQQDSEAVGDI